MGDERSEQLGFPRVVAYGDEVDLVYRRYGWEGDELQSVWLDKAKAEAERDRLNGEPYEDDGVQDHYVQTVKFGEQI